MLQRNHTWKEESVNSENFQFSSVAQSCPILCDPMNCSMPGFPVYRNSWILLRLMSIQSVMPSNYFILCHPLLLLHSIFPSIRVFSNESILCIRWPKYWSFSFSFSPSFKYSELISFRMHWFDILAWTVASLGIQENSNTPSLDKPSEICPCYNNLWERPFSLL